MVTVTQQQRDKALEVIKNTMPEGMIRALDPVHREYLSLTDTETVEMPPVRGHAYTVYVARANNRTPDCPVHINIHGGGWFGPHKENDALWASWLADHIRGIVVDIDYTTTATAPFPTALEQCYATAQWVFRQCGPWGGDPARISMGGYSAGGNLTAAVALMAVESGSFALCLQVLGYPPLDMKTPALYKPEGYDFMLAPERGDAYNTLYFGGDPHTAENPLISPVYASDEALAKVPRALILSAGRCSFRFENEDYAARLAALGVEVTVRRFPNSNHGFIPHFNEGWREAGELIAREIGQSCLQGCANGGQ